MTKFNLNLKNLNSTQFWIKQWGVKTEAIFFLNGTALSSSASCQRAPTNPINDFITDIPLKHFYEESKSAIATFGEKLKLTSEERKGHKYFQFNFLIESQIFPLSIYKHVVNRRIQ